MNIKINKFSENLKNVPIRKHYNDAGLDCYATDSYVLKPHKMTLIPLGFGIEIPDGYCGFILPRSSMNLKNILTPTGTIDSGYRGEIKCILVNMNDYDIEITPTDRICQLVIVPIVYASLCSYLGEERESGGFGSTNYFTTPKEFVNALDKTEKFGTKLKKILILNNIKQMDLAKELGITEGALSRYIHNKRVPSALLIGKIAKVLGVSVEFLIGEYE